MYIVWQIMFQHYSSTGVRISCTGRGSIVAGSLHITSKYIPLCLYMHSTYIKDTKLSILISSKLQ